MTDIRSVADPIDKKIYYPQTHYLAVIGLLDFVNNILDKRYDYVSKINDLKLINTSGHFYFDQETKNKPADIPRGYLQAYFMDDKNGIIEVMTTNKFYEVVGGELSEIKERM